MVEPITKKINILFDFTEVAAGDKLLGIDVSVTDPALMTKLLPMNLVTLYNANQLSDNIVVNSKILNGEVTASKLGAGAALGNITDGSIPAGKLGAGAALGNIADGSIPATKLGAIKRTVAIPVFGLEDIVFQKNFTNIFRWPMTLDGHSVTGVRAVLLDALSSNGGIGVAIINAGGTASSFTIAQGARAGTAGITAAYKASVIDQPVSVNITYSGTTAKGLTIYLEVTG